VWYQTTKKKGMEDLRHWEEMVKMESARTASVGIEGSPKNQFWRILVVVG
jgi:hypothetical protein